MIRRAAFACGLMLAGIGGSSAETPEQRQACTDSAFQFCQQAMPDRERVFACLIQNKDVIAPLCREAMAPYLPPEPAPKEASKPRTKIKTSAKTNSKTSVKVAAKAKSQSKASAKPPSKANAKAATKAKTKTTAAAKSKSKKIAAPLNLNPKAR
jgi:hypothetical protein